MTTSSVAVNGVTLHVREHGSGPAMLLVHGFPHTGAVWEPVVERLVGERRMIVPDLRGFGASEPTGAGLDADTLSRDLEALLLASAAGPATVVAIDAGVAAAFLLGLRRPDLLDRLVLIEALLGPLPGAERPADGGPPWWFGFHREPGLAERVLRGNEADYVGWFYDQGTRNRGVRPDLRAEITAAFGAAGALGRALGVYRALPATGRQLLEATGRARLSVPTVAVGADTVGRALEHQLRGVADDLVGQVVDDCGHIVPVDRPDELVALLR